MWFACGDDGHCGIGVELGFDHAWGRSEVLLGVFEVVVPSGFGRLFGLEVFFPADFVPFFGVKGAFFDGFSIEVVDEVPDPVFDSGADGVDIPVGGFDELDVLAVEVDVTDELDSPSEVTFEVDFDGDIPSFAGEGELVRMGSGVEDHVVCGQFLLGLDFESVLFESGKEEFGGGFELVPSFREVFLDIGELFHG